MPGGLRNNNSPHESHFQAFQDAPSESKNNEKTQKSSRTRTVTPLPRMPGLRPSSSYAADAPSRDAGSPSELLLAIDALRSPHHCTPTAASHCPCARISCTPLSRPGLAPAWASGGRWWSCSPRSIAHRHLAPAIASSPLGLPGGEFSVTVFGNFWISFCRAAEFSMSAVSGSRFLYVWRVLGFVGRSLGMFLWSVLCE